MVDLCRSAKHATEHPEKPSFICLNLRGKERIGLMTEWCWSGSWKILLKNQKKLSFWKVIPASEITWVARERVRKGWSLTRMVVNRLMSQAEACKKILVILSPLDCFLKAWIYVVLRGVNMHVCLRTAGLRHPAKTGWRKMLQVKVIWFVCRFALYVFILCRCEYSQFSLGNKSTLQFSHGVTKCIFRLLIYCNTPSSEKSRVSLRSILFS